MALARQQVDPDWKRGISVLRLGFGALQMLASDATNRQMLWLPIPLRELEPWIPTRRAEQTQTRAWFSRIELRRDRDQPTISSRGWLLCESKAWSCVGQSGCSAF